MVQYSIMGLWIQFSLFGGHENDNEAVLCNTEQRQYKEDKFCDGFHVSLRWFYSFP